MKLVSKVAAFVFAGAMACLTIGPARAGEILPFDAATFVAARSAGQPIVVDIAANWCPTCATQKPIIERLAAAPQFDQVTVFHVDFDNQRDVVRSLGASMQSTLIAFRGDRETARSVGDTDPYSISDLFRSAIGE